MPSEWFMTRRYEIVRELFPQSSGGFIEAFKLAIVEFSSLGVQKFDIAGYPYDTESEALEADWLAIARDCQIAAMKVVDEHGQEASAPCDRKARQ